MTSVEFRKSRFRCLGYSWYYWIAKLFFLVVIVVVTITITQPLPPVEKLVVAAPVSEAEAELPTSQVKPTIPEERFHHKLEKALANNQTQGKPVLPNLLLIGAPKAGSSAVESWLFANGICAGLAEEGEPSWYNKHLHFFDMDNRYANGKEFYKKHYAHCFTPQKKYKFRIDATPSTILHPGRVYNTYFYVKNINKLKIILVLREPIAREMASYNNQVALYQQKPDPTQWYANVIDKETGKIKTFADYVDTVTLPCLQSDGTTCASAVSHYSKYLKLWFQFFDPTQILILYYETDIRDTNRGKQRVRDFLQIDLPTQKPFPLDAKADIPCSVEELLTPTMDAYKEELNQLLRSHKRPTMEQGPLIPIFKMESCQADTNHGMDPDKRDALMDALNQIS